jgi:hypothetical protein
VRQQVVNGDRLPGVGARRQVGTDRVLYRELALLLQPEDDGSSELLRDRAEAKLRLRGVRRVPFRIRHAVALHQDRRAIARDEHGAAKQVHARLSLEIRVRLGHEFGGGNRDRRRRGGRYLRRGGPAQG